MLQLAQGPDRLLCVGLEQIPGLLRHTVGRNHSLHVVSHIIVAAGSAPKRSDQLSLSAGGGALVRDGEDQ